MNDSTPPALFDLPDDGREPAPPAEPLGRGATRQALIERRIAAGLHPLCGIIPKLRVHPQAPKNPRDVDEPGLRCGDCVHRRLVSHHTRTYPKCFRIPGLSDSHGESSDIRAWWPACIQFARPISTEQPREDLL